MGPTVPSSWARAASCDCSPGGEGGRHRAPGTGRPGQRAAAATPAPGRAAGRGVPTHSPGAAARRRRGARPPSSAGPGPLEDGSWLREEAAERCAEAEPPPGAPTVTCPPLSEQARGGNNATSGEGAAVGGRTANALTDSVPPPRPAPRRNVLTLKNQPIGASGRSCVGNGVVRGRDLR